MKTEMSGHAWQRAQERHGDIGEELRAVVERGDFAVLGTSPYQRGRCLCEASVGGKRVQFVLGGDGGVVTVLP